MDAKTRDLALLASLSLIFAWAGDRDIVGSVFFALCVVAVLGAGYGSGADMDKDYSRSSAPQPRARPASGVLAALLQRIVS
jgi:hypothetical protein